MRYKIRDWVKVVGGIFKGKGLTGRIVKLEDEKYTVAYTKGNFNYTSDDESHIEPYEGEDLNLYKFLRGYEGEKLFSVADGEVILGDVNEDRVSVKSLNGGEPIFFWPSGVKWGSSGLPTLYPSKNLYQSNPNFPERAWELWRESKMSSIEIKIDRETIIEKEFRSDKKAEIIYMINKLYEEL